MATRARRLKRTQVRIDKPDRVVIKTEVIDESYSQFYTNHGSNIQPVIKNEDIDPEQFVVKEEPQDVEITGFIAQIKTEENFIIPQPSGEERKKRCKRKLDSAEVTPQLENTNKKVISCDENQNTGVSLDLNNIADLSYPPIKKISLISPPKKPLEKDDKTVSPKAKSEKLQKKPATTTPKKSPTSLKKPDTTPKKPDTTPKKPDTTPKKHDTTPKKPDNTPKKPDTTPKKSVTTTPKKSPTPKKLTKKEPFKPGKVADELVRGCILHMKNIEDSLNHHSNLIKKYRKRVEAFIPRDKRFPIGNYFCYSCDSKFTLLSEWEEHMILYVQHKGCFPVSEGPKASRKFPDGWKRLESNVYQCDNCSFTTKHKQDVFQHIIAKHQPLSLKCGVCTKTFTTLQYLKKHLSYKHDSTRTYLKCPLCDYKTIDKYSLDIHNRIKHSLEGYFKCTSCDYKTVTNYKLKSHMINYHNPDRVKKKKKCKCIHCTYSSYSNVRLNEHIKLCHSDVDDSYKCAHCPYKSKSKMYLEVHIFKMHMKNKVDKNFQCFQCLKTFPTQSGMSTHMRIIHSKGVEVYPCQYCDAIFTAKHECFVHTNIKHLLHPAFQCNECSFRAKDDTDLRNHVFKQHRLKFYCHYCPFETHVKLNIYCHINNKHNPHTKIYKCSKCKYVSKNKCLLQQHVNVKHNPNPIIYSCYHCGHTNKIKHKLSQHMQTKHMNLLKKKRPKNILDSATIDSIIDSVKNDVKEILS